MRGRVTVSLLLITGLAGLGGQATPEASLLLGPQERSVDPVVLTGAQFAGWSAGPEITVREPQVANDPANVQSDCASETMPDGSVNHSCANDSRIPRVQSALGIQGASVDRLRGYRWTGASWAQIPFQVDERFTRYLTNNASGFAFYSGADQHTTYAFDREGFRFVDNEPGSCIAKQRGSTATDPIKGLDDNDELAFMYRDTGVQAPPLTSLPDGIAEAREVAIADPSNPMAVRYAYVMLAAAGGPAPAYDRDNGYVRYQRDDDAGLFVFSESSYEDYGNAPKGPYCNPDGTPALNADGSNKIGQRRPKDTAWVYTPRYKFRYDGRWLMTALHVRDPEKSLPVELGAPFPIKKGHYGPDLIDRWKARAFAQDPGSETPCCGYEEEDTNWGGSSILMGERSGPVRTIRETWGADSSTNNVRRETFYRDLVVWGDALRVHPIPPLDGIYVQWDYNAGVVDKYYNPTTVARNAIDPVSFPNPYVAIDGRNDEVFGNIDDPCNARYDERDAPADEAIRTAYRDAGICDVSPYHQSVDITDPTLSHPQQVQWEQVGSPHGSLVMRWNYRNDATAGTAAHSVVTTSYYRDDSCFDDGTGSSPGPKLRLRSGDEPSVWTNALTGETGARKCWEPGNPIDPSFVNAGPFGDREGDERYYQGSTGTTGLHLLLVAESDNLSLTTPVTEINTEQRIVVLEGDPGNVGEKYGRANEAPLATVVRPFA